MELTDDVEVCGDRYGMHECMRGKGHKGYHHWQSRPGTHAWDEVFWAPPGESISLSMRPAHD